MSSKKKNIFAFLALVTILAFTFTFTGGDMASAASNDPWAEAGIEDGGGFEGSGVYGDLTNIVYFVMALGGFWIIAMLVIGGMLLAGSNGNAQRRTAGLASLACTFLGGWVIMKAYTIAGWINGLGGGTI
ncbi:hypothetical protein IQ283_09130 (plasmid) [Alkalihalobacillus hwajinpoensis]|uniref:hypothetical protein n=1 Tax=Guptibacillus hwajinpoensis TaxID=208199 RepID=UPI0018836C65|nr:hypothetical protein [Pseudalkalibacillus hwajinpoensis]MBF0706770.1 hypothetical protein [Pseudalkalibacillus hwajinpoensis]